MGWVERGLVCRVISRKFWLVDREFWYEDDFLEELVWGWYGLFW